MRGIDFVAMEQGQSATPLDVLGRLQETVTQFLRPIEFRIVQTSAELTAAFQLVYREYLARHYVTSHPAQLKLSLHHALPTTTTFVAMHHVKGVVGTITLACDSPLGLPMDEIYKSEVDRLRQQGLRVAEATMLALDSHLFGQGVFTLFHAKKLLLTLNLLKVMFDYLRSCTPIDELVACFNPKHQMLYDFLQLLPLGELKSYSGANGNPAIARHLNVAATQRRAKQHIAYRLFYGQRPSPAPFQHKLVLSPEELRRLFVVETHLFLSASPSEMSLIKQSYPAYDFDKILQPSVPSSV